MLSDEQRFSVPGQVKSETLDGEAVLLDLASGTYFSLNDPGTVIWQVLCEQGSVGEARAAVVQEFEVEEEVAQKDLQELLEELLDKKLLKRA